MTLHYDLCQSAAQWGSIIKCNLYEWTMPQLFSIKNALHSSLFYGPNQKDIKIQQKFDHFQTNDKKTKKIEQRTKRLVAKKYQKMYGIFLKRRKVATQENSGFLTPEEL